MPGLPVSEAIIAYWPSSYSPRYKENAGIISRTVIQCLGNFPPSIKLRIRFPAINPDPNMYRYAIAGRNNIT
jgi:hypothetical protein